MKAYKEIRGKAPFTLNLGISWNWVVNIALPGERTRYPLNRRVGGTHRRCGHFGRQKKLLDREFIFWPTVTIIRPRIRKFQVKHQNIQEKEDLKVLRTYLFAAYFPVRPEYCTT
jgi:uncharacterized membrane protein YdbT with pleckstrin-like domain